MSEQYQHQAAPNAPVVTFSDKPLTVNGVKIYPSRPWSDDYRKWVRKTYSKNGHDGGYYETAADKDAKRTRLYREWQTAKAKG